MARSRSKAAHGRRRGLRGAGWSKLAVVGLLVLALGAFAWRAALRGAPRLRRELSLSVVRRRAPLVDAAARQAGIEPELAAALMFCESSGDAEAVSDAGALGLFQLMPATAREWAARLGLAEPRAEDLLADAELNARLGTHYLAWLIERCGGDVERALASYNTGPGRVDRWVEEAGSYAAWREQHAHSSSVLAYARKVLGYRDFYRERRVFAPPDPPAPLQPPPDSQSPISQ